MSNKDYIVNPSYFEPEQNTVVDPNFSFSSMYDDSHDENTVYSDDPIMQDVFQRSRRQYKEMKEKAANGVANDEMSWVTDADLYNYGYQTPEQLDSFRAYEEQQFQTARIGKQFQKAKSEDEATTVQYDADPANWKRVNDEDGKGFHWTYVGSDGEKHDDVYANSQKKLELSMYLAGLYVDDKFNDSNYTSLTDKAVEKDKMFNDAVKAYGGMHIEDGLYVTEDGGQNDYTQVSNDKIYNYNEALFNVGAKSAGTVGDVVDTIHKRLLAMRPAWKSDPDITAEKLYKYFYDDNQIEVVFDDNVEDKTAPDSIEKLSSLIKENKIKKVILYGEREQENSVWERGVLSEKQQELNNIRDIEYDIRSRIGNDELTNSLSTFDIATAIDFESLPKTHKDYFVRRLGDEKFNIVRGAVLNVKKEKEDRKQMEFELAVKNARKFVEENNSFSDERIDSVMGDNYQKITDYVATRANRVVTSSDSWLDKIMFGMQTKIAQGKYGNTVSAVGDGKWWNLPKFIVMHGFVDSAKEMVSNDNTFYDSFLMGAGDIVARRTVYADYIIGCQKSTENVNKFLTGHNYEMYLGLPVYKLPYNVKSEYVRWAKEQKDFNEKNYYGWIFNPYSNDNVDDFRMFDKDFSEDTKRKIKKDDVLSECIVAVMGEMSKDKSWYERVGESIVEGITQLEKQLVASLAIIGTAGAVGMAAGAIGGTGVLATGASYAGAVSSIITPVIAKNWTQVGANALRLAGSTTLSFGVAQMIKDNIALSRFGDDVYVNDNGELAINPERKSEDWHTGQAVARTANEVASELILDSAFSALGIKMSSLRKSSNALARSIGRIGGGVQRINMSLRGKIKGATTWSGTLGETLEEWQGAMTEPLITDDSYGYGREHRTKWELFKDAADVTKPEFWEQYSSIFVGFLVNPIAFFGGNALLSVPSYAIDVATGNYKKIALRRKAERLKGKISYDEEDKQIRRESFEGEFKRRYGSVGKKVVVIDDSELKNSNEKETPRDEWDKDTTTEIRVKRSTINKMSDTASYREKYKEFISPETSDGDAYAIGELLDCSNQIMVADNDSKKDFRTYVAAVARKQLNERFKHLCDIGMPLNDEVIGEDGKVVSGDNIYKDYAPVNFLLKDIINGKNMDVATDKIVKVYSEMNRRIESYTERNRDAIEKKLQEFADKKRKEESDRVVNEATEAGATEVETSIGRSSEEIMNDSERKNSGETREEAENSTATEGATPENASPSYDATQETEGQKQEDATQQQPVSEQPTETVDETQQVDTTSETPKENGKIIFSDENAQKEMSRIANEISGNELDFDTLQNLYLQLTPLLKNSFGGHNDIILESTRDVISDKRNPARDYCSAITVFLKSLGIKNVMFIRVRDLDINELRKNNVKTFRAFYYNKANDTVFINLTLIDAFGADAIREVSLGAIHHEFGHKMKDTKELKEYYNAINNAIMYLYENARNKELKNRLRKIYSNVAREWTDYANSSYDKYVKLYEGLSNEERLKIPLEEKDKYIDDYLDEEFVSECFSEIASDEKFMTELLKNAAQRFGKTEEEQKNFFEVIAKVFMDILRRFRETMKNIVGSGDYVSELRKVFLDNELKAIDELHRMNSAEESTTEETNKTVTQQQQDVYNIIRKAHETLKNITRGTSEKRGINTNDVKDSSMLTDIIDGKIGEHFDAHGIAKGKLSEQLDSLLFMLNNGIRNDKQLYTAPFSLSEENRLSSASLGTATNGAYKDGLAVVLSGCNENINDNGIKTVFINDLVKGLIPILKNAFPTINFYPLSENISVLTEQYNTSTSKNITTKAENKSEQPVQNNKTKSRYEMSESEKTAHDAKKIFDDMADSVKESGRKRIKNLIERDGKVVYENEIAAKLHQMYYPNHRMEVVDGVYTFYPEEEEKDITQEQQVHNAEQQVAPKETPSTEVKEEEQPAEQASAVSETQQVQKQQPVQQETPVQQELKYEENPTAVETETPVAEDDNGFSDEIRRFSSLSYGEMKSDIERVENEINALKLELTNAYGELVDAEWNNGEKKGKDRKKINEIKKRYGETEKELSGKIDSLERELESKNRIADEVKEIFVKKNMEVKKAVDESKDSLIHLLSERIFNEIKQEDNPSKGLFTNEEALAIISDLNNTGESFGRVKFGNPSGNEQLRILAALARITKGTPYEAKVVISQKYYVKDVSDLMFDLSIRLKDNVSKDDVKDSIAETSVSDSRELRLGDFTVEDVAGRDITELINIRSIMNCEIDKFAIDSKYDFFNSPLIGKVSSSKDESNDVLMSRIKSLNKEIIKLEEDIKNINEFINGFDLINDKIEKVKKSHIKKIEKEQKISELLSKTRELGEKYGYENFSLDYAKSVNESMNEELEELNAKRNELKELNDSVSKSDVNKKKKGEGRTSEMYKEHFAAVEDLRSRFNDFILRHANNEYTKKDIDNLRKELKDALFNTDEGKMMLCEFALYEAWYYYVGNSSARKNIVNVIIDGEERKLPALNNNGFYEISKFLFSKTYTRDAAKKGNAYIDTLIEHAYDFIARYLTDTREHNKNFKDESIKKTSVIDSIANGILSSNNKVNKKVSEDATTSDDKKEEAYDAFKSIHNYIATNLKESIPVAYAEADGTMQDGKHFDKESKDENVDGKDGSSVSKEELIKDVNAKTPDEKISEAEDEVKKIIEEKKRARLAFDGNFGFPNFTKGFDNNERMRTQTAIADFISGSIPFDYFDSNNETVESESESIMEMRKIIELHPAFFNALKERVSKINASLQLAKEKGFKNPKKEDTLNRDLLYMAYALSKRLPLLKIIIGIEKGLYKINDGNKNEINRAKEILGLNRTREGISEICRGIARDLYGKEGDEKLIKTIRDRFENIILEKTAQNEKFSRYNLIDYIKNDEAISESVSEKFELERSKSEIVYENFLVYNQDYADFVNNLAVENGWEVNAFDGWNVMNTYDSYLKLTGGNESLKNKDVTEEQRNGAKSISGIMYSPKNVNNNDDGIIKFNSFGVSHLDRMSEDDRQNLLIAKQMYNDGKDMETIMLATGWASPPVPEGFDLQWSQYNPIGDIIDDFDEEYMKLIKKGEDVVVSDIYSDERMFSIYPELKNMKIVFKREEGEIGEAYYSSSAKYICLPKDTIGDTYDSCPYHVANNIIRNIIAHELQHAIQDIEGYYSGGNEIFFARLQYVAGKYINPFLNKRIEGDKGVSVLIHDISEFYLSIKDEALFYLKGRNNEINRHNVANEIVSFIEKYYVKDKNILADYVVKTYKKFLSEDKGSAKIRLFNHLRKIHLMDKIINRFDPFSSYKGVIGERDARDSENEELSDEYSKDKGIMFHKNNVAVVSEKYSFNDDYPYIGVYNNRSETYVYDNDFKDMVAVFDESLSQFDEIYNDFISCVFITENDITKLNDLIDDLYTIRFYDYDNNKQKRKKSFKEFKVSKVKQNYYNKYNYYIENGDLLLDGSDMFSKEDYNKLLSNIFNQLNEYFNFHAGYDYVSGSHEKSKRMRTKINLWKLSENPSLLLYDIVDFPRGIEYMRKTGTRLTSEQLYEFKLRIENVLNKEIKSYETLKDENEKNEMLESINEIKNTLEELKTYTKYFEAAHDVAIDFLNRFDDKGFFDKYDFTAGEFNSKGVLYNGDYYGIPESKKEFINAFPDAYAEDDISSQIFDALKDLNYEDASAVKFSVFNPVNSPSEKENIDQESGKIKFNVNSEFKRKEEEIHEENIRDPKFGSVIKAFLKSFRKNDELAEGEKPDISLMNYLIGLANYYADYMPELRRFYDTVERYEINKKVFEKNLIGDFINMDASHIGYLETLRKKDKKLYKAVNDYLIATDRGYLGDDGEGHFDTCAIRRIRLEDRGKVEYFIVDLDTGRRTEGFEKPLDAFKEINRNKFFFSRREFRASYENDGYYVEVPDVFGIDEKTRKKIESHRFETVQDAALFSFALEREYLINSYGFTEEQAVAVEHFRNSMFEGFKMRNDVARRIDSYVIEKHGHSAESILDDMTDEEKRCYNIYNELKQMGSLITSYVPRLRVDDAWWVEFEKDGKYYKLGYKSKNVAKAKLNEIKKTGTVAHLIFGNRFDSRMYMNVDLSNINVWINEATQNMYRKELREEDDIYRKNFCIPYVDYYTGELILSTTMKNKEVFHNLQVFAEDVGATIEDGKVIFDLSFEDDVPSKKKMNEMANRIIQALANFERDDTVMEAFIKALQRATGEMVESGGAAERRIERDDTYGEDVTVGYEEDTIKIIKNYAKAMASSHAKTIFAKESTDAITGRDYTFADWWRDNKVVDGKVLGSDWKDGVDLSNYKITAKDRLAYALAVAKRSIQLGSFAYDDASAKRDMILRNNGNDRGDAMMNGFVSGMNTIASIFFLSSPSSGLVNTTSIFTNVPAAALKYLGTSYPVALGRVLKYCGEYTYFKANKFINKDDRKSKLSERDRTLFRLMAEYGFDGSELSKQLTDTIKCLGWAKDISMFVFRQTEELSRASSIMAMYDGIEDKIKEKYGVESVEEYAVKSWKKNNKGATLSESERKRVVRNAMTKVLMDAKRITEKALGDFSATNKSAFLSGGAGKFFKAAILFWTFNVTTLNMIARKDNEFVDADLKNNYGVDLENARARRVFATIQLAISQFIVGGLRAAWISLPLAASVCRFVLTKIFGKQVGDNDETDDIDWLVKMLCGYKSDEELKSDNSWIKGLYDFLDTGLVGSGLGVNLHGSLDMYSNVRPIEDVLLGRKNFSAKDVVSFAGGAAGSVASQICDSVSITGDMIAELYMGNRSIAFENGHEVMERLLPRMFGNFVKARRESKYGLKDSKGRYKREVGTNDRIYPTGLDTFKRSIGFNPRELSKKTDEIYKENKRKYMLIDKRKKISKEFKSIVENSSRDGTLKEMSKSRAFGIMLEHIKEFNDEVRNSDVAKNENISTISSKDLRNWFNSAMEGK